MFGMLGFGEEEIEPDAFVLTDKRTGERHVYHFKCFQTKINELLKSGYTWTAFKINKSRDR